MFVSLILYRTYCIAFCSYVFILFLSLALHIKCQLSHQQDLFSTAVHVFYNLFWKICPLLGQILITCLKCSMASFLPSSYSDKMYWRQGWVEICFFGCTRWLLSSRRDKYFRLKNFLVVSIRNFLGRNFFFWVSQVNPFPTTYFS